jgi:hypothetical protein
MKYHKYNTLLTLTYADEALPTDSELNKRDLQLFLKRLRRAIAPLRIRYFGDGEYGKKKGKRGKNPHYHIILFGISASEVSRVISRVWTYGQTDMKNIDGIAKVAAYVSGYVLKEAIYARKAKQAPFRLMSRGCKGEGGIGYQWIRDHKEQVRENNGRFFFNGKKIYAPTYYLKKAFTPEERRARWNEAMQKANEKIFEEMRIRGVTFEVLEREHQEKLRIIAQDYVKKFSNKKGSKLHYVSPTNKILERFLDAKNSNTKFIPESDISIKLLEEILPNMTAIKHIEIPTNLSPP